MNMLDRLLSNLYRAIDKSPEADTGLIITHDHGVAWVVADRVLTVKTEKNVVIGSYILENYTLHTLAEALQADGCTIIFQNQKSHLSAACIIAGTGVESESNGNHLLIYTSLAWVLLDSLAVELEKAKAQIPNAIAEIDYTLSDTEFTDYWGKWWGIPRLLGESDADYKDRTIYEITRPRSNPYAIEINMHRMLGEVFRVREPWKEVMYLSDGGALSVDKHMQGKEWQYHYSQTIGWGKKLLRANAIHEADRPAGTLLLDPQPKYPGGIIAFPDIAIQSYEDWVSAYFISIGLTGILSENLVLSGYVDDFTTLFAIGELLLFANIFGVNELFEFSEAIFCRGEIILSDSDPLETLQAHFGGRKVVYSGRQQALSTVNGLSDGDFEWHYEPIDVWVDENTSVGELVMPVSTGIGYREDTYGAEENIGLPGVKWTGRWDTRRWMDSVYVPMVMTETM